MHCSQGSPWALCRGGFVAVLGKGAGSLVVIIQGLLDARALQAPRRFPDARVNRADLRMHRPASAGASGQAEARPIKCSGSWSGESDGQVGTQAPSAELWKRSRGLTALTMAASSPLSCQKNLFPYLPASRDQNVCVGCKGE